jgi:hypothetical protein
MLVVMTLGLWFSATNHCRLEVIPGLEILRCASEDSNGNCDGDGCDIVEKGFSKTESNRLVIRVPPLVSDVSFIALIEQAFEAIPPSRIELTSAPPELPRLWQFSLRAALPPRAPSIAS